MARETDQRKWECEFLVGGGLLSASAALACQTHICPSKSFFAVKIQHKDVTGEDSTQSTMLFFNAKWSQFAGVFPSPPPPPPLPLCLSLRASVSAVHDLIMLPVFLGLCVTSAADQGKNSLSVYGEALHTHVSIYSPHSTHGWTTSQKSSSAWFKLTTNRTPNKPHAVNKEMRPRPYGHRQSTCDLFVDLGLSIIKGRG